MWHAKYDFDLFVILLGSKSENVKSVTSATHTGDIGTLSGPLTKIDRLSTLESVHISGSFENPRNPSASDPATERAPPPLLLLLHDALSLWIRAGSLEILILVSDELSPRPESVY